MFSCPLIGISEYRYKNIRDLIKRCETLVITRDESRKTLQKYEEEIGDQEKKLSKFKEAQHERILKLR